MVHLEAFHPPSHRDKKKHALQVCPALAIASYVQQVHCDAQQLFVCYAVKRLSQAYIGEIVASFLLLHVGCIRVSLTVYFELWFKTCEWYAVLH